MEFAPPVDLAGVEIHGIEEVMEEVSSGNSKSRAFRRSRSSLSLRPCFMSSAT
jgi:hypothetical protein